MQFDLEVGLDGMMEALANTTGDPAGKYHNKVNLYTL